MNVGWLLVVGDEECGRADYIGTYLFRTQDEAVERVVYEVRQTLYDEDIGYTPEEQSEFEDSLDLFRLDPERGFEIGLNHYDIRPLEYESPLSHEPTPSRTSGRVSPLRIQRERPQYEDFEEKEEKQ